MDYTNWRDIIITLVALILPIINIFTLPYTIIGIQTIKREKKDKEKK